MFSPLGTIEVDLSPLEVKVSVDGKVLPMEYLNNFLESLKGSRDVSRRVDAGDSTPSASSSENS